MSFEDTNPMLLTDFYKSVHHFAYVRKMEHLVAHWTPRMSRIEGVTKVVFFEMQAYAKQYLVKYFNQNFFERDIEEICEEYYRIISSTMNPAVAGTKMLRDLHSLGYLPIRIKAVPEGTLVNIGTPMFSIESTVEGFGWVTNYLETLTSCNVWQPMTAATIAFKKYRKEIIEPYFEKTVCDGIIHTACGDFSMRGMYGGPEGSAPSSAAHLLSFSGSATIPAILWLEKYYNCRCDKELVGKGTPSMEHSVMSSYGPDEEFEAYRFLIEDVEEFRTGPLSIVSDTYDYWNVITNYLPKLKDSIMKRDGKIIIRGDSGNPVDIICGTFGKNPGEIIEDYPDLKYKDIKAVFKKRASHEFRTGSQSRWYWIRIKGGKEYRVECFYTWEDDGDYADGGYMSSEVDEIKIEPFIRTPEEKGTVELLWDIFGGHINKKGYKVLDSHIGAIYGDGITPLIAKEIYEREERKGFAVNNCILGIGSYTYQYVTRDTFGFALKATHAIVDGEERQIYKDPITDKSKGNNFKKSQRGMCYVYRDGDDILYKDGLTIEDLKKPEYQDNLLQTVFENSKMVKEYSLAEIRNRLHNNSY